MSNPASPLHMNSFYDILGVSRDASIDEIRKAYKRQALRTHPDRASNLNKDIANEEFKAVNAAYEVLGDENNRRLYDTFGVWPPPDEFDSPPPPPFEGGPIPRHPHARPFFDDMDSPFHAFDNGPFGAPPFPPFGGNPFFGSPFGGPRSRQRFTFTDPFALFNSMFKDFESTFSSTMHDFDEMRGPMMPPFPAMPSMGAIPPVSAPPNILGGLPLLPGAGPHMRPGPPSRHNSLRGPMGGMPATQWVSESRMTRTVNGVTESVWKRTDHEGNEYVTKRFADGTERHTINGVDQPQAFMSGPSHPPMIEDGPRSGHRPGLFRRRDRDRDRERERERERDMWAPPPMSHAPPPNFQQYARQRSPSFDDRHRSHHASGHRHHSSQPFNSSHRTSGPSGFEYAAAPKPDGRVHDHPRERDFPYESPSNYKSRSKPPSRSHTAPYEAAPPPSTTSSGPRHSRSNEGFYRQGPASESTSSFDTEEPVRHRKGRHSPTGNKKWWPFSS